MVVQEALEPAVEAAAPAAQLSLEPELLFEPLSEGSELSELPEVLLAAAPPEEPELPDDPEPLEEPDVPEEELPDELELPEDAAPSVEPEPLEDPEVLALLEALEGSDPPESPV